MLLGLKVFNEAHHQALLSCQDLLRLVTLGQLCTKLFDFLLFKRLFTLVCAKLVVDGLDVLQGAIKGLVQLIKRSLLLPEFVGVVLK